MAGLSHASPPLNDCRGTYAPVPREPNESANCAGVGGAMDDVTAPENQSAIRFSAVKKALEERKQLNESNSFIERTSFQIFGVVLIMSNALVIGLETDLGGWAYWDPIEHTFLALFTLELLLKICALGPRQFFFFHEDTHWNLFDFFIVGLGLFDFVMGLIGKGEGVGSFATIFRIIRLLRILRLFRIVKFLKQLYVLVFGLVEAVKAVFWVTLLMLFVLYVCSIVLVKTVGRPAPNSAHSEFLSYRFGHILDCMLTLFILMSSPNLPTYQDEEGFVDNHFPLTLFLCGFIIFGSFGIIALLTGVISQSMFEKNEVRKEQVRLEHEEMRRTLGVRCEALFTSLEVFDVNGETTVETVKLLAPDMWELLTSAGAEITHDDVERVIEYMDVNGTGLIGPSEFTSTVEKIAEGLSVMGIQEIHNRLGICESKIDKVQSSVDGLQQAVQSLLDVVTNNHRKDLLS